MVLAASLNSEVLSRTAITAPWSSAHKQQNNSSTPDRQYIPYLSHLINYWLSIVITFCNFLATNLVITFCNLLATNQGTQQNCSVTPRNK